jgi:hypothetical protein
MRAKYRLFSENALLKYRLKLMITSLISMMFGLSISPLHASDSRQSASAPITFDVCHGFSCQFESTVNLTINEWRAVRNQFFPLAVAPAEERQQIKRAVGLMEIMSGKHTPTYRDVKRNSGSLTDNLASLEGQLDCVDEAINTTTYLTLFQQNDLLRHHTVADRAYRRALLDQHWAGQLIENSTGNPFVVDSWFGNNGDVPYIVAGKDWFNLSIFGRRNKKQKTHYTVKLVSQK